MVWIEVSGVTLRCSASTSKSLQEPPSPLASRINSDLQSEGSAEHTTIPDAAGSAAAKYFVQEKCRAIWRCDIDIDH